MNPTLLRALKGAPISTLIALRFFVTAGPSTLAQWTGYDRKTTAKALAAMESMGLVLTSGRYDAYRLTEHAETQLPLFIPAQLAPNYDVASFEGENLPLVSHEEDDVNTTHDRVLTILPIMKREGENLPLARLTTYLAHKTGYSPNPIRKAIAQALEQGDDPYDIEYSIDAWLAYCEDHSGVKVPGALVAARIRDGQPAPPEYQQRTDVKHSFASWCSVLDRDPNDEEPATDAGNGGYRVPPGYEDLISY